MPTADARCLSNPNNMGAHGGGACCVPHIHPKKSNDALSRWWSPESVHHTTRPRTTACTPLMADSSMPYTHTHRHPHTHTCSTLMHHRQWTLSSHPRWDAAASSFACFWSLVYARALDGCSHGGSRASFTTRFRWCRPPGSSTPLGHGGWQEREKRSGRVEAAAEA